MQMQEIVETLSAAKAPKKDGKGNPYVDVVNVHRQHPERRLRERSVVKQRKTHRVYLAYPKTEKIS